MLAGKSIEEWLKINRKRSFLLGLLGVEGFTGVVGEPHFFVFLDAADNMAIGAKIVLSGKSILSRKSQGFP